MFITMEINMSIKQNLSWDEYFMSLAIVASLRSKDPNTKVGAVIVDSDNHVVATGYNGFIKGIDESKLSMRREGNWLDTKYPYICHAEINCLLNSSVISLKNTRLYCTLFPCNDCMKAIAQSGISEIIYLSDKHSCDDMYIASRKLLELSGIAYRQLDTFSVSILINLLENL